MISDTNFAKLTSGAIDLSSVVVTDNLDTISRWNIFSRISNADRLESQTVARNIKNYMRSHPDQIARLDGFQRMHLENNLIGMKEKFSHNDSKQAVLTPIFEEALSLLSAGKPAPKGPHETAHTGCRPKKRMHPPVSTTKQAPVTYVPTVRPTAPATSLPPTSAVPKKVESVVSGDALESQRRLVEAISMRTAGTSKVITAPAIPQAVIDRRIQMETASGLTQTARKAYHVRDDVAVIRTGDFTTPRFVKLRYDETRKTVVEATPGSFDVGARLRSAQLHHVPREVTVY
jgi:hypothetical protein